MAVLGGSPLGLIGIMSGPSSTGMSTFNGGRSRNVNVNLYNSGRTDDKERLAKAKLDSKSGAFSLFTGGTVVKPWGNIQPGGTEEKLKTGIGVPYNGVGRKTLHNNDVYDTSILNIVERTANTAAQLRPSDFAYLKNIGVYPNNRLMIARRFNSPAPDDIYGISTRPAAILISWRTPVEDFLEISFGEEWIDAKADFTEVINNIGEDLAKIKPVGGVGGAGLGIVPIPGWSEALVQGLLVELGILNGDVKTRRLAAGNPNLIKMAKRRKTLGMGEAGSGLTCTVSIKMTCEYEQKFISGIDPTIAYMDILSNVLRFGTSNHVDYGLSVEFGAKIKKWADNPQSLISDMTSAIEKAVTAAKTMVLKLLEDDVAKADDEEADAKGKAAAAKTNPPPATADEESAEEELLEQVKGMIEDVISAVTDSIAKCVNKYAEEIKGIANALMLSASTPWHITLGNPLRPVFCSGDMYTTSVALSLGTNLAFNDLPSNIKIDFTLANARPWGLGDIMGKFNTGNLRTVNTQVDSASLSPAQSLLSGAYHNTGNGLPAGDSGTSGVAGAQSSAGGPASPTNQNLTAPSTTTKENQSSVSVNSDPNSATGPVKGESVTTSPTVQSSGTSGTSGDGLILLDNLQSQQNQQSDQDIDPVANANSSSEKGYKYSLVKTGNLRSVIVYNKENAKVFESAKTQTVDGQSVSGVWTPKDEAKLVEMVKDVVGDK